MNLETYEVQNWGPHKSQKIVFPAHAKTIAICAENDQGKSWILRGIGFTLSIGKNEYGDQTSIHAGETQAYHKLCIQHNKKTYTIEKILKSKSSEEEGTLTLIDGLRVDKSKYEEFYTKTLGLPLPSIWLPLAIALQNETDIHLRSKKSAREEALRSACQLSKIDSWKEALQTKVKEEDKTMCVEDSSTHTKLAYLLKEKETAEINQKSLEDALLKLSIPLPNLSLEKIISSLNAREESEARTQKLQMEKITLEATAELLQNTQLRIQSELAKLEIPNLSEEELEDQKNCLQESFRVIQRAELTEKIKVATKKISESENKKKSFLLLSPISVQNTENQYQKCKILEDALANKIDQITQIRNQMSPNWAEIHDFQSNLRTQEKTLADVYKLKAQQDSAIQFLTSYLGEVSNPHETKLKIEEILAQEPAISLSEASQLTIRLLSHWEESTGFCPVCTQSFQNSPLKGLPFRKLLKNQLKEELLEGNPNGEKSPRRPHIDSLLSSLQTWIQTEAELHKHCQGKDPHSFCDALATETKSLLKDSLLNQQCTQIEKEKYSTQKTLKELLGIETLNSLKESLQLVKKQTHENALLDINLAHLHKEIDTLRVSIHDLTPFSPNEIPQPQTTALNKEEIQKKLKAVVANITQLRKSKAAKFEKERELVINQTKIENHNNSLSKLQENLRLEKELQERHEIPIPPNSTKPDCKQTHREIWRACWTEKQKIEHFLQASPNQIQTLTEKIAILQQTLKTQESRKKKLEASKKVIEFLDYKNAPRRMLQDITQKLFDTTNKLGESLNVDIQLQVGKNLEFLTKQKRNGKIIEQKTERLGFGKSAILGICFRLACQKLLIPDTGFLLLDEPSANVDLKRKTALKSFLQKLTDDTTSPAQQIILIEHDLDVISLCQAKIHITETIASA